MTNEATETCSECGATYPAFGYCMPCDARTKAFDAAMDDSDYRATLHVDDQRYVEVSMAMRDVGRKVHLRRAQASIAAVAKASGRWARDY